jgi:preprotein translocase subunit SecA
MPEDFQEGRKKALARYQELLAEHTARCKAEGDEVRALGGLYVIGSERHDSRRIDNQLRGRSGRQGDPGESRFFLSLDDDLMRLFATGALSYVMGRALPDDEAIEARMVTKAIERAQTTVETKNAEIRKNVLKYDEVMNEQRKVIYKRRDQILAGADLKEEGLEYLADAVDSTIDTFCVAEFAEEWDLEGLVTEIQTFWPSTVTMDELREAGSTDTMYDLLMSEATAHYEEREADLGEDAMREVERQVMLRIIDQRWREHLYEMDYLQEGINLRAMGQKDPLVEWQREGYSMFSEMMHGIAQDFVRYVMHVQVVQQPAEDVAAVHQPSLLDVATHSSEDVTTTALQAAAQQALAEGELSPEEMAPSAAAAPNGAPAAATRTKQQTVVKDEWSKTGRNEPCPCGSGKKYKMCHGR